MPKHATSFDSKTIAVNALKNARKLMLKDLVALPEDAYHKKFGLATRTVADLVYEVNLVNDHVGMVIRGEEPFVWPDGSWITAPDDLRGKDSVIDAFKKSIDRIIETAESFTNEEFEETFETEEGETTRYERCRFMTLHMWYHSGQLNFVQTILGDDVFHWEEG